MLQTKQLFRLSETINLKFKSFRCANKRLLSAVLPCKPVNYIARVSFAHCAAVYFKRHWNLVSRNSLKMHLSCCGWNAHARAFGTRWRDRARGSRRIISSVSAVNKERSVQGEIIMLCVDNALRPNRKLVKVELLTTTNKLNALVWFVLSVEFYKKPSNAIQHLLH
jgi:hypothetical protein